MRDILGRERLRKSLEVRRIKNEHEAQSSGSQAIALAPQSNLFGEASRRGRKEIFSLSSVEYKEERSRWRGGGGGVWHRLTQAEQRLAEPVMRSWRGRIRRGGMKEVYNLGKNPVSYQFEKQQQLEAKPDGKYCVQGKTKEQSPKKFVRKPGLTIQRMKACKLWLRITGCYSQPCSFSHEKRNIINSGIQLFPCYHRQ